MCSETGTVSDIHFWVSWNDNIYSGIPVFTIVIWSDMPADDPGNPYGYSVPRERLWERDFVPGDFTIVDQPPDIQGWYDPTQPYQFWDATHDLWHQINIVDIDDPFVQDSGSIYWLEIDFHDLPFVGWKASEQHWNDDAVFYFAPDYLELRDPRDSTSIDLAFVITGEPTEPPIPTLTEWGLIILALMLLSAMTWFILRRRNIAAMRV
jgi:hypothetical protein